jgi:hypothetical protein
MVERGQEVYRAHRWSSERSRFLSIAESLLRAPKRLAFQVGTQPKPELEGKG